MKFVDIAVNLTDPMFRGIYRNKQVHASDLGLVVERAAKAGVQFMITGTSLQESAEALHLAGQFNTKATVGCHPTQTLEWDKYSKGPDNYSQELRELIRRGIESNHIGAIGELGLDYDRLQFSPKDIQLKYFQEQLDICSEFSLPLFLHDRNTGGDFRDIIIRNRHKFTTGVVHSFTGTVEEMLKYSSLGLYIGVNGCSLKTEENLEVVKQIPLDKLLLETDSPWCEIRPTHASAKYVKTYESKVNKKERFVLGEMVKSRNEPRSLLSIATVVAELKGLSVRTVADATFQNSAVFGFQ